MQAVTPDVIDALVRDVDLRLKIADVVRRRGVPHAHVEDVIQKTYVALARAKRLPEDPAVSRKYVLGIARRKASQQRREQEREDKRRVEDPKGGIDLDALPAPDSDANAPESHEVLWKLWKTVPAEQVATFRCYVRHHVYEESIAALAREYRIDKEVLYKRVQTMGRRLKAAAVALGALALILALSAAWRVLLPKPEEAHKPLSVVPTSLPAVSSSSEPPVAPLEERDLLAEARDLRAKAFAECTRNDWKACLTDLAAASALDRDGDKDPLVQAAHKDAFEGIDAKPDWRPPLVRPYAPKGSR